MAVTVVFNIPGMNAGQYDRIIKSLEAGGAGSPDGRLLHVASPTDDGWLVFDVWESEEKFGRFAEVLMPIVSAEGIQAQPQIYQTHNIVKG